MDVDAKNLPVERRPKLAQTTQWLTFVTAVLGLLTAVLTIALVRTRSTADSNSDQVSTLTDQLNAGRSQISSLQASVGVLQSQIADAPATVTVPAPSASAPAAATSPSASTPAVRHEGTLYVEFSTAAADLDAPSSDPQWGRGSGVPVSEAEIARYTGKGQQYIYAPNGIQQSDTAFSYGQCFYSQLLKPLSLIDVHAGGYICFHTDDNRVSLLHITDVTTDRVTLQVVTYEGS